MMEISERLLAGDRRVLSRVISQFERGDPEASQVLKAIDPHTGSAYTVDGGMTATLGGSRENLEEADRATVENLMKGLNEKS